MSVFFIDGICDTQIDPQCRAEASPHDAAVFDGSLHDASAAPDASDADAGTCDAFRQVPGCPCAAGSRGCTHCGHVTTCESGLWVVDRNLTCGGCF